MSPRKTLRPWASMSGLFSSSQGTQNSADQDTPQQPVPRPSPSPSQLLPSPIPSLSHPSGRQRPQNPVAQALAPQRPVTQPSFRQPPSRPPPPPPQPTITITSTFDIRRRADVNLAMAQRGPPSRGKWARTGPPEPRLGVPNPLSAHPTGDPDEEPPRFLTGPLYSADEYAAAQAESSEEHMTSHSDRSISSRPESTESTDERRQMLLSPGDHNTELTSVGVHSRPPQLTSEHQRTLLSPDTHRAEITFVGSQSVPSPYLSGTSVASQSDSEELTHPNLTPPEAAPANKISKREKFLKSITTRGHSSRDQVKPTKPGLSHSKSAADLRATRTDEAGGSPSETSQSSLIQDLSEQTGGASRPPASRLQHLSRSFARFGRSTSAVNEMSEPPSRQELDEPAQSSSKSKKSTVRGFEIGAPQLIHTTNHTASQQSLLETNVQRTGQLSQGATDRHPQIQAPHSTGQHPLRETRSQESIGQSAQHPTRTSSRNHMMHHDRTLHPDDARDFGRGTGLSQPRSLTRQSSSQDLSLIAREGQHSHNLEQNTSRFQGHPVLPSGLRQTSYRDSHNVPADERQSPHTPARLLDHSHGHPLQQNMAQVYGPPGPQLAHNQDQRPQVLMRTSSCFRDRPSPGMHQQPSYHGSRTAYFEGHISQSPESAPSYPQGHPLPRSTTRQHGYRDLGVAPLERQGSHSPTGAPSYTQSHLQPPGMSSQYRAHGSQLGSSGRLGSHASSGALSYSHGDSMPPNAPPQMTYRDSGTASRHTQHLQPSLGDPTYTHGHSPPQSMHRQLSYTGMGSLTHESQSSHDFASPQNTFVGHPLPRSTPGRSSSPTQSLFSQTGQRADASTGGHNEQQTIMGHRFARPMSNVYEVPGEDESDDGNDDAEFPEATLALHQLSALTTRNTTYDQQGATSSGTSRTGNAAGQQIRAMTRTRETSRDNDDESGEFRAPAQYDGADDLPQLDGPSEDAPASGPSVEGETGAVDHARQTSTPQGHDNAMTVMAGNNRSRHTTVITAITEVTDGVHMGIPVEQMYARIDLAAIWRETRDVEAAGRFWESVPAGVERLEVVLHPGSLGSPGAEDVAPAAVLEGMSSLRLLKSLKVTGICNTYEKDVSGLCNNYQKYIWLAVWLNPYIESLTIEVATPPELKSLQEIIWRKMDQRWKARLEWVNLRQYLGDKGDGKIHERNGRGEYLDACCIEAAKVLAKYQPGSEPTRKIGLKRLNVRGMVVDSRALTKFFDGERFKVLGVGPDAVDAGLKVEGFEVIRLL